MPYPNGVLYEKEEAKEGREPVGWVLLCNNRTEGECLATRVFGSPRRDWSRISKVKKGDVVYLLNYETNRLHGGYARGCAQSNLHESWMCLFNCF